MCSDWIGNQVSVYSMIGASNHSQEDREELDYYATDPLAAEILLQYEPDLNNIWENAVGGKHLANVFEKYNKLGRMSDIVNRTDDKRIELIDFLQYKDTLFSFCKKWDGDIVTNPPYKYAEEFVRNSIDVVTNNHKVCMFLKLTFLEGKKRKQLFKQFPPKVIYVMSSRVECGKNGQFNGVSAVCYAWFVWQKGYQGDTIIKWVN